MGDPEHDFLGRKVEDATREMIRELDRAVYSSCELDRKEIYARMYDAHPNELFEQIRSLAYESL